LKAYVGGITGNLDAGTIQKCGNAGAITGADYAGGIAGYAKVKLDNCYNLNSIIGTSGSYIGGIAGYTTSGVNYCFSYSAVNNNIRGGSSPLTTSYYFTNEVSSDPTAKNADAFKYGEVAYLLDKGKTSANKAWAQGENYPVLKGTGTTGSVYKLTLTEQGGSTTAAGSVHFALLADSPYKTFIDGDSHEYSFLPASTALASPL
jgi:hypothetical protein